MHHARPHMDSPSHSLLLAFDTDQGEFARGFEAGRLWALLQERADVPVEQLIHATNAEMALRMAEALSRDVSSVEVDDHWMKLCFGPAESKAWVDV